MRTLGFLVVVVAFLGCGPTQKCGPGNCSGCCDSAGACQAGNSNVNCGNGGLLCNACFVGQQCNLGICASTGSGGGSASGGGAGTTGGGGGSATGGGGGSATGGGGGSATGGGGGTATGGGGGSATGGGSGSSWTTWCNSYITSACDNGVRCGLYASATVCRSFAGVANYCATTPALRDGRQVLDSTAASACLNAMSGACDTVDYVSCSTALRGTGQLNQGCYGSTECATNLYCDLFGTCPGLCRASTPVGQPVTGAANCVSGSYPYGGLCVAYSPIAQSCAPLSGTINRTCVPEAFCQSGTLVCTAKRLAGQSCSSSNGECAGMLSCHGGVCEALGSSSTACDSTRSCRVDLKCSAANVCVALGGLNAPCTSAFGDCQYDLICAKPSGSSTGTCQAIHTVGQSCTFSGYECGLFASGNYCTATSVTPTGVCALKKGVGASCTNYDVCATGTCTNSVCTGCADPTP